MKVGTECAKLSNFNTAVAIAQALGQLSTTRDLSESLADTLNSETRAGESLALHSKESNALRQLRSMLNLDAGGKCPFSTDDATIMSLFCD